MKKYILIMLFITVTVGIFTSCRKRTENNLSEELPFSSVTESPVEDSNNGYRGYTVDENNLYINDTTNFSHVKAESADTMILNGPIRFEEDHYFDDDDDIEQPPVFDSYFAGCQNVSRIIMEEGSSGKVQNGEVYAEDNMLMYKNPKKGIYACPVTREGTVKISDDIWDIFVCAFQKCNRINKVEISASVRWVGEAAFGYMTKCDEIKVDARSKYLKSEDGVLYTKDGEVLIAYPAGKKDEVFQVPDGVRIIADGAFMGANNLKKIILTKNMFSIGEKAFMDCKNLELVKAKDKVTYIMKSAYDGCDKFKFGKRPKRKKYENVYYQAYYSWKCKYKYLSYLENAKEDRMGSYHYKSTNKFYR